MYQPHLARTFKLRRFCTEIDRTKQAALMSMVLEQIGKLILSKKQCHFSKSFSPIFLLQTHLTYSQHSQHGQHSHYGSPRSPWWPWSPW